MIDLPLVAALALIATQPAPAAPDKGARDPSGKGSLDQPAVLVWAESVPLRGSARSRVHTFRSLVDVPDELSLDVPSLICWGGLDIRVECRIFRSPGVIPSLATSDQGVIPHGQLILGVTPAKGATVAVILEGVRAAVPHLIPMSFNEDTRQFLRRVGVDEDGTFELAPLSPGVYRLEIEWPGGAITHSQPFELPPAGRLTKEVQSSDVGHVHFSLGQIVEREGAVVDVLVVDLEGGFIEGARVGAHQGAAPDWRLFESFTDEGGHARLLGFDPAETTTIACWAPGYTRSEVVFDHAPAEAVCSIGRLAGIRGSAEVEGQPLRGATAMLLNHDARVQTDESGQFELLRLAPGQADLAVSATGRRTYRERLDLRPGETLDVGSIELDSADEWQLRIVDRETGEALSGAVVESRESRSVIGLADSEGLAVVAEEPGVPVRVGRLPDYPFADRSLPQSPPPDHQPVEVALLPGGFLQVRAWDSEGDPCSVCSIEVQCAGVIESMVTDLHGEAVSSLLPAGRCATTLVERRSMGRAVHVQGGREQVFAEILPRQSVMVELGEARREVVLRFEEPLGEWHPFVQGKHGQAAASPHGADRWALRVRAREQLELFLSSGLSFVRIGALELDPSRVEQLVRLPSGGVVLELGEEPPRDVELFGVADAAPIARVISPGPVLHLPFIRSGQYILVLDGKAGQLFDVPAAGLRHLDLVALP